MVDLQCSVNFCCTAKWPTHIYVYIYIYTFFFSHLCNSYPYSSIVKVFFFPSVFPPRFSLCFWFSAIWMICWSAYFLVLSYLVFSEIQICGLVFGLWLWKALGRSLLSDVSSASLSLPLALPPLPPFLPSFFSSCFFFLHFSLESFYWNIFKLIFISPAMSSLLMRVCERLVLFLP